MTAAKYRQRVKARLSDSRRGQKARARRARSSAKTVEYPKFDRDRDVNAPTTGEDEFEGDVNARREWFTFQRTYPFNDVPEGARRQAWDEVKQSASLRGEDVGTTWAPIGPAPTTSAFPNNGGFTSGRINSVAIAPNNSQLILIGSATGGIWRSTNGGTNFTPVSDDQVDLAVGALAFAPSNPNIAYACMGDKDNRYFGTGVLKSLDAGQTWSLISNNTLPNKGQCTRVVVDPADPNKVYIAEALTLNAQTGGNVFGGIFVSTDGGVTWANKLQIVATDLVMHPTNSQILYAATPFDTGSLPGIFKTVNGGTTWNRVYTSTLVGSGDAFQIAVTPASPERVYAYFRTASAAPISARVEVSTDGGATWSTRPAVTTNAGGLDPGQFSYNNYLYVSPTDANTIYIGSRDVYRSTDGGITFTNVSNAWSPPYATASYTPNNQKFHSDQQAFAFQPGSSSTFYVANDGGLWKTTDGGTNFTSLNATLSLTQFVHLTLHPTDATKSYAGAQDNGTQRRINGGSGWTEFSSGDGGKGVINPLDPSMVFTSYVQGALSRFTNNGGTYTGRIADGDVLNDDRIAFYPPFVGNGTDSKLYVGTYRMYRCDNCTDTTKFVGGTPPTWTPTAGTFDQTKGGSDVLNSLAVAKSNNQVIYSGSVQGRVMISSNGGTSWTDITTGIPTRSVTTITPTATDPATAYLTVSGYGTGHVFKTTNSGGSWTDISSNLPNIPVSAFLIDPLTPTTIYAGTDIGVFRSTNDGASWSTFSNGMPPVAIMAFAAQSSGLIQVATYGRGAYELAPTGTTTPTPTPTPVLTPTITPTPTPGGGTLTVLNYTGAPIPIPDNLPAGINLSFPVSGLGTIADMDVSIDGTQCSATANSTTVGLSHTWVGDVVISLTSPQGTTVTLINQAGGANNNGVNFCQTVLNDQVTPTIQSINSAGAPYSGSFKPNSPLSAFNGQNANGTWVLNVSDRGLGDTGFLRAFSVRLTSAPTASPTPTPTPNAKKPLYDFDADGKSDVAVYRPSNGNWYINRSRDGFYGQNFGNNSDKLAPADYDGDGKTDLAVYKPSTGVFFIYRSSDGGDGSAFWGLAEDIPCPGDFDGDGKADVAIFRPSTGTFWIRRSASGNSPLAIQYGASGDQPVVGDYDGDGKADVAVYRPTTGIWYIHLSQTNGDTAVQFGIPSDKAVPGDFDGDGKTDIAVYRTVTGLWFVVNSTGGYTSYQFGYPTDTPAPADYDGDGKIDMSIFRPGENNFWINGSKDGVLVLGWGTNGDQPIANAYVR